MVPNGSNFCPRVQNGAPGSKKKNGTKKEAGGGGGGGGGARPPRARLAAAWASLAWLAAGQAVDGGSLAAALPRPVAGALLAGLGGFVLLEAYQTSSRDELSRSLMSQRPLDLAPRWMVGACCCCYLVLAAQGLRFAALGGGSVASSDLEAELHYLALLLCFLYALETALALGWGVSTMSRWSRFDYVTHHLPYVLVVGGVLLMPHSVARLALRAYRRTLPLNLFMGFNEAAFAAQALAGSAAPPDSFARRCLEPARIAFAVAGLCALLPAESAEILALLRAPRAPPPPPPLFLRAHACACALAPLQHAFLILPLNLRRAAKLLRRSREVRPGRRK